MSDDKAEELKRNILSPYQWIRILYMAFYAVACWVLLFVLPVIIVCQVIISLITGDDNSNLRDFGKALSDYFHQAMNYLVYATDEKPWPFSDGEDLGDSFSDDGDDDDEPEEDETPAARPAAPRSGDDVFDDISFTGDQKQERASDDGVDYTPADDGGSDDKKDSV
jgi:hypothetical protein